MHAMRQIDRMTNEGFSFDDIERYIDTQVTMNEGQRDALWLYAWATQPDSAASARETVLLLA